MNDAQWIISQIENLVEERCTTLPVEWAEEKRFLPSELSPLPGLWRANVAPYCVEILNHILDSSPVREIAVAKGAQTCLTVGVAENWIGYTIDADPCALMYATADDRLARERMKLSIDPMIDLSGLRGKISSQTDKTRTGKKGGDTQTRKEFPGGFLLSASLQSPNRGRSFPVKRLILDEIDAAPAELKSDGDPISVFVARTNAYGETKKILYISTPLEKTTSKIWPLFEKGDQRKYFVPCPVCGHMQILEWGRLKFEYAGKNTVKLGSVHYECCECQAHWKNHDKVDFLAKGEWRATAKSQRPGLISYHLSGLYSPIGFLSWEEIAQKWIEAQSARQKGDYSLLRTFINLVLGEPWENRGEAPRYELIMSRRSEYSYNRNSPPDEGPLFLTAGVDVQGNRLEVEVVAWGVGNRSWSVCYEVIEGDVTLEEPWIKLQKFLSGTFKTVENRELRLMIALIDSGYKTDIVYSFCDQLPGVFPSMGQPYQNRSRWAGVFKQTELSIYSTYRFDLNVDLLKETLYTMLKRGINDDDKIPEGFCHFPTDYTHKYFRQLTAEERVMERDKSGRLRIVWKQPDNRPNEALDCRVMAMAGLHIIAHEVCVDPENDQIAILWDEFWVYAKQQLNPKTV